MRVALFLLLTFLFINVCSAQTDSMQVASDSIALAKQRKKQLYQGPKRAGVLSAMLPGLGQAYNGKYWKIPVIYAALGGGAYLFYVNNQNYELYRNALRNSVSDSTGVAVINGIEVSTTSLLSLKKDSKKFRDMGVIAMAIIYVFNIVDASVDAHLKTFDVSDDLSLQVQPHFDLYPLSGKTAYTAGFTCRLNFK